MKILELTNFSAGICGVWQRVKQESELLSKRSHNILVVSSNATKGNNEIAPEKERVNGFNIIRKPYIKIGGESFMFWNFEKEALDFKPDVIVAHSYRHPHTTKAIKIAKKLNKQGINTKVFLVTHAPFERERGFIQNTIVAIYDILIGKSSLKKFDKVIAITQWEIPYLKKLGVEDYKIIYMPNGIPKEFFELKKQTKEENKILFLGRVSPIKNIETLIKAVPLIKDKKIILEIVGPREEEYKESLDKLIKQLNLNNRIIFSQPIYDLKEKIKKIDSAKIFVLPSVSEGMSQSLVEAMAREKIVVASDNTGNKDLIENNKNGYLFEIGNEKKLAEKINLSLMNNNSNKKIRINAKKSVEKFNWDKIINQLISLF